jgi:hypothetical protein
MDWIGFGCFTTAIISLLLALTFDAYEVADRSLVYGLIILTAVGLVAFVWQERRHAHPLLDLSILANREFTGGVMARASSRPAP